MSVGNGVGGVTRMTVECGKSETWWDPLGFIWTEADTPNTQRDHCGAGVMGKRGDSRSNCLLLGFSVI